MGTLLHDRLPETRLRHDASHTLKHHRRDEQQYFPPAEAYAIPRKRAITPSRVPDAVQRFFMPRRRAGTHTYSSFIL
jgi:hypothetical protein